MDKIFPARPPPVSGLGRYRRLSPRAGVHVSPIQLGAMSIGDQWHDSLGSMDKQASFALLDTYFDKGGNFIDTANNYQDGSSERFIGEWAEQRGIRDRLFIATKYSNNWKIREPDTLKTHQILYLGNHSKSLKLSVEQSLKNLRTSYIDLLYVHWWDFQTSIEEMMNALHNLVTQGKVLYLGVSDSPAWAVAQANQYARDHNLTPFVVYQGSWNVMERDFEREIIPMARANGMALAPFNVLAGGKIRTDAEEERRLKSGENGRTVFSDEWRRNDRERAVCAALEKVAAEVGAKHITSVAIAYVLHKTINVFPIIGGRKTEHLIANLEALEITLSDEQVAYLESVVPFDLGFPGNFIGNETHGMVDFMGMNVLERVSQPQPAKPRIHKAAESSN
ncbi:hypothetical protein CVT24_007613 [Panaeolus cyanescens]|uniref:NADP-dependent oxidoreductase domain-containing protein n=1 Tax=Panaeolus cyanescens TaxID=181874 RepID=A0A409YLW2_9AGAR|nr:hypothetical protein CVT24_007613 [Panaeolus cyanescens]